MNTELIATLRDQCCTCGKQAADALEAAQAEIERLKLLAVDQWAQKTTAAGASPQPDADPNAPWLTEAHVLCADHGIAPGHITERLRALRDVVATLRGKYDLMTAERNKLARQVEALEYHRTHPFVQPSQAREMDAKRYQALRRGQKWSVIDGIGDTLRGDALDAAIDAAINAKES